MTPIGTGLRCTWHKGKVEGQRTGEVGEKHLGQSEEGSAEGDERGRPALPTCLAPVWFGWSQSGTQAMDRGRPLRRSSKNI